jgi:hypothetical protein
MNPHRMRNSSPEPAQIARGGQESALRGSKVRIQRGVRFRGRSRATSSASDAAREAKRERRPGSYRVRRDARRGLPGA